MNGLVEVRSPYNGDRVGEVLVTSSEEIEEALATAYALHRDRRQWLPKQDRISILRRAAEIVSERREFIAWQAANEGGKPLKDSLVEVDRAVDGIQSCIEALRTSAGQVIPMDLNTSSSGRVAFTQHEPIGVVVAISAFNHPFNLVVHQVAPAVAVGAPIIIKPAEKTPLSCRTLIEIFSEAGLPAGWAQMVIPGSHEQTGRFLSDRRVGFLSFIGSANVGWMLRSKLAPGTRAALEHGGVAPVIVTHDADLEMALPRLAKAAFWHAGQACISVQRIFCDNRIAQRVADGIAASANVLTTGDPLLATTDVGPLISHKELSRVSSWVDAAVRGGATIVAGGRQLSQSCYANTVLLDAPKDADVLTKEVFGPVVCVVPYDRVEDALAEANALPFAFQASVFTRDLDTAMQCYRHLDGTAIMVNETPLFRTDWMPFAGARQSGLGVGGIPSTMHEMQIEKMMVWRSDALASNV